MKKLSLFSLLFPLIILSCNSSNQEAASLQSNESGDSCISTKGYSVRKTKSGTIVLLPQHRVSILTKPIPPGKAVKMIAEYIKDDINADRKLGDKYFKYISFNSEQLLGFISKYESDSIRIYMGKYDDTTVDPDHPEYSGWNTCIIVAQNGLQDIYEESANATWPINIGTLCPPGCYKDNITDDTKGAIYLKKAAKLKNVTSWEKQ